MQRDSPDKTPDRRAGEVWKRSTRCTSLTQGYEQSVNSLSCGKSPRAS